MRERLGTSSINEIVSATGELHQLKIIEARFRTLALCESWPVAHMSVVATRERVIVRYDIDANAHPWAPNYQAEVWLEGDLRHPFAAVFPVAARLVRAHAAERARAVAHELKSRAGLLRDEIG